MTPAQKKLRELRERQSKERQKMAELGLADSLTDEQRSELDTIEAGTPDLERQLRAAQVAVEAEDSEQREAGERAEKPEEDAEARDIRALRQKAGMQGYLTAATEKRTADGAHGEYLDALKIPRLGPQGGAAFPLALLAPEAERRATTDTDTVTTPRRWLDRLFAGTAAAQVGVTMESVPAGSASFPVTTAGAAAAQYARAGAAADAAWTVGVTELKPTRNAARAVFTVEDAMRIPGLESALTRDLRMALVEGVDRAVFLGDATANAVITGFTTAAGLTEQEITQDNKIKGAETLKAFAELIDGVKAMGPGDLKTVMAVGANTLWSHTLANTGASVDTTIGEFLKRFGLSWVTRGEIEAATAADDFAAFIGLGRGLEGAGVMAMWEAGELIRDPYSGAAKGEVALTLCYLWNFGLPRASNFARVKFTA